MVAIEEQGEEVEDLTEKEEATSSEKQANGKSDAEAEDTVDKADDEETKSAPAAEQQKAPQQPQQPINPAAVFLTPFFCVTVALVSIFMQQAGGDVSLQGVQKWSQSLFEPHVVLPPEASDNEVVIQFCQSWGTNGVYNQINQLIQQKASRRLSVTPASYPPSKLQELMSTMVGALQMSGVVSLFAFDKALPEGIRENKMMVLFAVWFGGSMVSSSITKTNAFEIYVGKQLIWSTKKHQRMPNLRDLVDGFQRVGVQLNVN